MTATRTNAEHARTRAHGPNYRPTWPCLSAVSAVARTPVTVGFGIATPGQARAVGRLADGVIIGSALINAAGAAANPPAAARAFVGGLRAALKPDTAPAFFGA